MSNQSEDQPLSEEEVELARAAMEETERMIAEAKRNGTWRARPWEPGRQPDYEGALGLDNDGNIQPPISSEEQAHNAEIRRRAVEDPEALQEELDQRLVDLADPEDADDPNLPDYIREQIRQKFQEK